MYEFTDEDGVQRSASVSSITAGMRSPGEGARRCTFIGTVFLRHIASEGTGWVKTPIHLPQDCSRKKWSLLVPASCWERPSILRKHGWDGLGYILFGYDRLLRRNLSVHEYCMVQRGAVQSATVERPVTRTFGSGLLDLVDVLTVLWLEDHFCFQADGFRQWLGQLLPILRWV